MIASHVMIDARNVIILATMSGHDREVMP